MGKDSFDWDPEKDLANRIKHDISFLEAQYAFADPNRVIAEDLAHSNKKEPPQKNLWVVSGTGKAPSA